MQLEDLKEKLKNNDELKVESEKNIQGGLSFKLSNGCIVNFYIKTNKIQFQGRNIR